MPRKEKCYHYLYKTTNLINNKYYYGMHSTSNLNDGYLGSGKKLRYSIRKYGKDNFKIEILQLYNNREELIKAEIDLITSDLINEKLCMNLKVGGSGGFRDKEHQMKCSKAGNDKLKEKRENVDFKENWIKKISNKLKSNKNNINSKGFKGKKHTQESKNKISRTNSENQKGKNNSQYGTCWINRFDENKKIKKEELEEFIKEGWVSGRKIKKDLAD
jgi:hypothetical protein